MSVFTFNLHSFHTHIVNDDLHCITILFFKKVAQLSWKKIYILQIFLFIFLVHTVMRYNLMGLNKMGRLLLYNENKKYSLSCSVMLLINSHL